MTTSTVTAVSPQADAVCARLADDGFALVDGLLLEPDALAHAREETAALFETTPLGRDGFAQPSVGVVQTLSMAIVRRVL